MSSHLEAAISYRKDSSDETCDFCGCIFNVVVSGQKGHEESEEYYCPECSKKFTCRASNSPRVTLKEKRTDGHTNKYGEISAK